MIHKTKEILVGIHSLEPFGQQFSNKYYNRLPVLRRACKAAIGKQSLCLLFLVLLEVGRYLQVPGMAKTYKCMRLKLIPCHAVLKTTVKLYIIGTSGVINVKVYLFVRVKTKERIRFIFFAQLESPLFGYIGYYLSGRGEQLVL